MRKRGSGEGSIYYREKQGLWTAQVYVDGTLRGTTPLKVDVPPGKHRVRITHAGYRNWEYQVSVMETREYPINVVLRQLP